MNKYTFQKQYGPWAIVTGASAGIGAEFARQIAGNGINVVLVARRAEKLTTLANEFEQRYGVETRTVPLDLTQPDFLTVLREATDDLDIGLLVNNAGAGNLGRFLDNSLEAELRILDLNVRAPMVLTHSYGQDFRQKGRGSIIIVSSMVAFCGVSHFANYAATKAYDMLLAEGLAKELRADGVEVMSVLPGFTESEYMADMDLSRIPMPIPLMKTPTLVSISLDKLGTNTPLVIPGVMNQMMKLSFGMMGRGGSTALFSWMLARMGHPSQAKHTSKAVAAS